MPLMLGGTAITIQLSKSSSCVRWNGSKHSLLTYFHLPVFIPPQTFENIVLTVVSLNLKCIKIFLHCSWCNFQGLNEVWLNQFNWSLVRIIQHLPTHLCMLNKAN